MNKEFFLKISLLITSIAIAVSVLNNLLPTKTAFQKPKEQIQIKQLPLNRIDQLIEEGMLSEKEAEFYQAQ